MDAISGNSSSIVSLMTMLQQLYHPDTSSTASSSTSTSSTSSASPSTTGQNAATATAVANSIAGASYLGSSALAGGNLMALLESQSFDDAATNRLTGQVTDAAYTKWTTTADKDGDGLISKSEFEAAVPSNVTQAQADQLFASIDTAGTGSVTAAQLRQGLSAAVAAGPTAAAPTGGTNRLFVALDTDGSATISKTEFENDRASGLTQDQADAVFNALDLNGDGTVTAAEFGMALSDAGNNVTPGGQQTGSAYSASQAQALQILSQMPSGSTAESLTLLGSLSNSLDTTEQSGSSIQGSVLSLLDTLG